VPLKPWPEDPAKWVNIEELIVPIKKAIKFAYKLKRIRPGKDIPYDGYTFGGRSLCMILDPEQSLTKEQLRVRAESNQMDALDVILQVCFNLGYEQGRRAAVRDRLTKDNYF
jgi:hypothetical protein